MISIMYNYSLQLISSYLFEICYEIVSVVCILQKLYKFCIFHCLLNSLRANLDLCALNLKPVIIVIMTFLCFIYI